MPFSLILTMLAAVAFGAAVLLIVSFFLPAMPNLSDLLATLDRSQRRAAPAAVTDAASLFERVGQSRMLRRVPGPAVPYSDLDLLGISPQRFVGYQFGFSVVGLLLPAVLAVMVSALGLPVTLALPLIASLGFAVLGWLVPHVAIRRDATIAREQFGRAVTSYIDLVVLERLSGAGVASAAVEAAQVARAPLFVRINETLLRRQLERQPPHVAVRDLADSINLPELRELADTLMIASQDSPVTESLRAKARTIRNTFLAQDVERAGQASQRQTAATALLLVCFLAFLGTPVVIRLLAT